MKRYATKKRRFYPKHKLEIIRDISTIRLQKAQRRLGSRRFMHDIRVRHINNIVKINAIKPSSIRSRY